MLPGVIRTRVGYTGGTTKNPTYYKIGDHTESFQVDFDPKVTSYEKILEVYWSTHNHCAVPNSRQYMSAIFFADEKQKNIAWEMGKKTQAKLGKQVTTYILPLRIFTLAEDYHQKYMLRQRPDIVAELTQIYPNKKDYLNSTAATRLNAYLGGHGSSSQLQEEISGFGLSQKSQTALINLLKSYGK